jgi:hypothetical protein
MESRAHACCTQKEGEWRPGQKGIALSLEQFQTLQGAAGAITEALQSQDTSYRLPLSGRRDFLPNHYSKGASWIPWHRSGHVYVLRSGMQGVLLGHSINFPGGCRRVVRINKYKNSVMVDIRCV